MSAPYRVVFVDPTTQHRHRFAALHGRDVILEDLDAGDPHATHYLVISADRLVFAFEQRVEPLAPTGLSAGLLALAEAIGVAVERPRGEQPLVEFTDGPRSFGPLWDDAHLARVFGLDFPAGGAA